MPEKRAIDRLGTILIADDHEVFRYGLGQILRRDLHATEVVEAARFEEALELLRDPNIVLAIVDLSMPGLSTPRDLAQLRRQRPDVCVIVLTGSDKREHILAALEAGVHGYIVKGIRTESMVEHIKYVLTGEIYVPPILAELPSKTTVSVAEARTPAATLTERQQDVLRLIIDGLSNKEIGRALKISEGTVKMHVAAILQATGASNRARAAAIGKQFLD